MHIENLLNPVDYDSSSRYSVDLHSLTPILEDIYDRYPHPSTFQLQAILKRYPTFPSITYLRSWFNNRHSKSLRDLNQKRERNIIKMRLQCRPFIYPKNTSIVVDLKKPITSKEKLPLLIDKLQELQSNCRAYLDMVYKLNK